MNSIQQDFTKPVQRFENVASLRFTLRALRETFSLSNVLDVQECDPSTSSGQAATQLMMSEQNPERSVARDDDSSTKAGNIKYISTFSKLIPDMIRDFQIRLIL
jgi:hypothetical protein